MLEGRNQIGEAAVAAARHCQPPRGQSDPFQEMADEMAEEMAEEMADEMAGASPRAARQRSTAVRR